MRAFLRRIARAAALIAAPLALGACATGAFYYEAADSNLIRGNYAATDALMKSAKGVAPSGGPLLVATMVNIDSLGTSSTLGRLISEHVASRLAQTGYTVTELKMRDPVYVRTPEGELMLSRELKEISAKHGAQAVAVGTYTPGTGGSSVVFVSLKLVRPADNTIVGATDYALVLTPDGYGLARGAAR